MSGANLGELQSILIGATRCLECSDPGCVKHCPAHVDVRAAMRLIVGRRAIPPSPVWAQPPDEATASVMNAIEASFEPD